MSLTHIYKHITLLSGFYPRFCGRPVYFPYHTLVQHQPYPPFPLPPRLPPSIMNLKLPAFIFFISTLISIPTSLAQEAKHDHLDKMRAALHDLAQPAPTLDVVVPANQSDLNPPRKREEPELPRVIFYVCAEPLLSGRCEKLSSKRGFCCTSCLSPPVHYLPAHTHTTTSPSHGTVLSLFFSSFHVMRVQYLTIIIIDKLKNGWDDEISSLCPQAHTKCTVYE